MRAVCLGFGPKVPLWLKSIVIPGLGLWAVLRVLDMEIFCTSRHVFLVHAFGHGGDILAPNHLPSYSIFGYLSQETSQSDLISEENCVGKGIQWKSAIWQYDHMTIEKNICIFRHSYEYMKRRHIRCIYIYIHFFFGRHTYYIYSWNMYYIYICKEEVFFSSTHVGPPLASGVQPRLFQVHASGGCFRLSVPWQPEKSKIKSTRSWKR